MGDLDFEVKDSAADVIFSVISGFRINFTAINVNVLSGFFVMNDDYDKKSFTSNFRGKKIRNRFLLLVLKRDRMRKN